jgi:neutral ceramidase
MPTSFTPSRLVLCVLTSLLLAGSALAQSPAPTWKAGVAKTVVTPAESIWMAGFGSRDKTSEGVRQDIYVRAAALQDADGRTAVIATFDLAGVEKEMADAIAERCRREFNLPRDRLMLNISHTHSGPVAGLVLMPLYDLTPAQRDVVRRYTDELIEKTVRTIGQAIRTLQPATVEFGQSLAGIAVNRRRATNRSLPGPVDHDVPVLAVRTADGKLAAVLVGYAAHATVLNDYLISNDWPGFALSEIEQRHPGVTALFLQGCGGDANPLPRRVDKLARMYGEILAYAVDEVLRTKMTPLSGSLRTVLETTDVPFYHVPTRAELDQRARDANPFVRLQAKRLIEVLERDGRIAASYPYPVQVWQFGKELTFIALGGEVVADYSLRLKNRYGFERTWVAGYSNDILAYIPSRRVLEEGGYEGGESMIYFGRPSRFGAGVEEIIVEKVNDLVEKSAAN